MLAAALMTGLVAGCWAVTACSATTSTTQAAPGSAGAGLTGAYPPTTRPSAGGVDGQPDTSDRSQSSSQSSSRPSSRPDSQSSSSPIDQTGSAGVVAPTPSAGATRTPSAGGTLLQTRLTGAASGVTMRLWVWLPPQYDDPAYAHSQFPALMLFPGGSGAGYNTWSGHQYGAQEFVAQASRTGRSRPFVFVMPQMQLSDKLDTECADLPGAPKVGTFLAQDVRAFVLAHLRVSPDRSDWGAAGASSGAYCVTRLVFNHPDQYAAVAAIDGYFHIETPLPGARSPQVLASDPDRIAVTAPPSVDVLLLVGADNRFDVQEAGSFQSVLRPPTRVTLVSQAGGRHTTKDFARTMPQLFDWMSARVGGP